ncbi:MAG: DUF4321 domain-containing protein [Lachnospiraceae bacterium]
MKKNNWACFLLVFAGIVLGGFLGTLLPFEWLNYGETFGLDSPVVLNLGLIVISFSLTIKITVGSLVGIAIALILYRFL